MLKELPISQMDENITISPEGKLEGELAKQLETYLMSEQVADSGAVVIDLKNISVVTADGVRVLLNAYIDSQTSGRKLHLSHVNNEVSQLMHTVGLAEIMI